MGTCYIAADCIYYTDMCIYLHIIPYLVKCPYTFFQTILFSCTLKKVTFFEQTADQCYCGQFFSLAKSVIARFFTTRVGIVDGMYECSTLIYLAMAYKLWLVWYRTYVASFLDYSQYTPWTSHYSVGSAY